MTNPNSRIAELIGRHFNGTISEPEGAELNEWVAASEENRQFFERYNNEHYVCTELEKHDHFNMQAGWEKLIVKANIPFRVARPVVKLRWILGAAAAVVILFVSSYFWFTPKQNKQVVHTETLTKPNDIGPGKDGAILKLADGKEIVLDNSADGNLARQGTSNVIKQGTELRYNDEGKKSAEVLYNTLSTPRGRQFQLVLPDGTKAFLNAASSITFPTAFTGKERVVKVQGEVFIEVAKDAKHPFKVSVNEMQVEALGTQFNINAYQDEDAIKTTLIEGKVKISGAENNSSVTVLAPGQQALLQKQSGKLQKITDINVDQVVAWKNGLFQFDQDDLHSVMRQISRWYDVEVVYDGNLPKGSYGGKIWRSSNLSQVLEVLESSAIHFKIEGNKIIVTR
jgi:transmembrane sensor